MGYYGGKGGRHVRTVGPLDGRAQPTPSDGPKNLVACRWEPGFTLDVPEDWPSGVYLVKLTNLDSRLQAYAVFVVRDDRPADLLFQCSDLTWQAYNRWPAWRSLYDWKGNKWHTTVGADVGFDRPYSVYYNGLPSGFNPLTNGSGEFLLWEHPLCFWLEQQGYDVTYISNLDTHADPDGLLRAGGFLSVGHDEYWTQAMYDNVRRARDAGVALAFLSGNSVYHRIDLRPGDDGQPHRVFGRVDQFADEQELIGATSYGVGLGDWVCRRPDHWLFEGTGMKEGDRIPQLVGWEYHGLPVKDGGDLVVVATGETKQTTDPPYAATVYDGGQGERRLQRRDLLVGHAPGAAAGVAEPAEQGLRPVRPPRPADHEEPARPDHRTAPRRSLIRPPARDGERHSAADSPRTTYHAPKSRRVDHGTSQRPVCGAVLHPAPLPYHRAWIPDGLRRCGAGGHRDHRRHHPDPHLCRVARPGLLRLGCTDPRGRGDRHLPARRGQHHHQFSGPVRGACGAVLRAAGGRDRHLARGRGSPVALAALDEAATRSGVTPLSAFLSGDDLIPGEELRWFTPDDALRTAERLQEPDVAATLPAGVIADLERLRDALGRASGQGIRFCLLIREGSVTSGHEMSVRKGSFF